MAFKDDEIFQSKRVLILNKDLELLVGTKKAIILQQIHFLMKKNRYSKKHNKNNITWIYNSIERWHKYHFSTIASRRSLKNYFKELEDDGYLISATFPEEGTRKVKWYTINFELLKSEYNSLLSSDKDLLKTIEEEKVINNLEDKSAETAQLKDEKVQNLHFSNKEKCKNCTNKSAEIAQTLKDNKKRHNNIHNVYNNQSVCHINKERAENDILTEGQTDLIKNKIDISFFDESEKESAKELIMLIEDVFRKREGTERINGGLISMSGIHKRFMLLDVYKIKRVIKELRKISNIKNWRAYSISSLYNSVTREDLAVSNEVNSAFGIYEED